MVSANMPVNFMGMQPQGKRDIAPGTTPEEFNRLLEEARKAGKADYTPPAEDKTGGGKTADKKPLAEDTEDLDPDHLEPRLEMMFVPVAPSVELPLPEEAVEEAATQVEVIRQDIQPLQEQTVPQQAMIPEDVQQVTQQPEPQGQDAGIQIPVEQVQPEQQVVQASPLPVPEAVEITAEVVRETEEPQQQPTVIPEAAEDKLSGMLEKASQSLQQASTPKEQEQELQAEPREMIREPQTQTQQPQRQAAVENQPRQERPRTEQTAEVAVQPDIGSEPPAEPVKAQEPAPQPFIPMQSMEQIETEVLRNLDDQVMEFRMQLQPQELGKIDVRLVMESGKLSVEILAALPKTAELLSRQSATLSALIGQNGMELSSVQVVSQSQEGSAHMESAFDMQNFQPDGQEAQQAAGSSQRGNPSAGHADGEQPRQAAQYEDPNALLNYKI